MYTFLAILFTFMISKIGHISYQLNDTIYISILLCEAQGWLSCPELAIQDHLRWRDYSENLAVINHDITNSFTTNKQWGF